jgi:hypothetical protein
MTDTLLPEQLAATNCWTCRDIANRGHRSKAVKAQACGYEPVLVVCIEPGTKGMVTFLYRCNRDHWWTVGRSQDSIGWKSGDRKRMKLKAWCKLQPRDRRSR